MPALARAAAVLFVIFAVLFSGVLPAFVLWDVPGAGLLDTGQAEPGRWAWAAGAGGLLIGLVCRHGPWPWVFVGGMVSALALLCGLAGVGPGLMVARAMVSVALWTGAMTMLGRALACRRGQDAGIALGLAAVLYILTLRTPEYAARPAPDRAVGVMSALPLFWRSGERPDTLIAQAREQNYLAVSRWRLDPIDRLDGDSLARHDSLLLAQPRLLSPRELVALDDWVRRGGRALILADPLLLWPSDLPLGHALRPPLTSLLDPVLRHWGLELAPVPQGKVAVERMVLASGHVLMLAGASRFVRVGGACAVHDAGVMATCRIGRGQARLIADADLLDDRLWLSDRARPHAMAARSADTVAVIDHWIVSPLVSPPPSRINRVRDEPALLLGMRGAMLAGLGWVLLGLGWSVREKRAQGGGSDKAGGLWQEPEKPG